MKKILLWGTVGLLVILIGLAVYSKITKMPKKKTEYLGIKLTDTTSDVKFKRGEPDNVLTNPGNAGTAWSYGFGSYEGDSDIFWKEDKVRFIDCTASADKSFLCQNLNNIHIGDSTSDIFSVLGDDYMLSIKADNTSRSYSYKKYNCFFILEKDRVVSMGVYNPEMGNVKFYNEAKISNQK